MDRMRFKNDDYPLREKIFKVLCDSQTSVEEDLVALRQCDSHIRNRIIVQQAAKDCGVKFSGFKANEYLELYYDLKRGRHDVGYISKGWEEPGFRVCELIKVPKSAISVLKTNVYALLKFCATRGVAVTIEEKTDSVQLHMGSVIYSAGFNKKVFAQVLDSLTECTDKVHELFAE